MEGFDARLPQANLVIKTYFDGKIRSFNQKISSSKKKHIFVEKKLKSLKTFDSRFFKRQKSFCRRWYIKLFNISANVHICWKG